MGLASSEPLGWYIGFALAAVVVLLVAALLIAVISTVRRITTVAEDITATLVVVRDRTEVLWQVATTNRAATDILTTATAVRETLERS